MCPRRSIGSNGFIRASCTLSPAVFMDVLPRDRSIASASGSIPQVEVPASMRRMVLGDALSPSCGDERARPGSLGGVLA